jgi:lysophospholipase L1-like esterase
MVALVLLAAEAGLALVGFETGPPDPFTEEERAVVDALDEEFAALGPRARRLGGTVLYLYVRHRSAHYNVNSLGMRAPEPTARQDGEFRILMMGGSTIWGTSVADDATVPAYLEDALRRAHPERPIRVYNAGIEGYRFQREIAFAKRLSDEIRPDLVLFYHGDADIAFSYARGYLPVKPFRATGALAPTANLAPEETEAEGEEPFFVKSPRLSPVAEARERLRHSRVALLVYLAAMSLRPQADVSASLDPRRASLVEGYLRDAQGVREYFSERSIETLFVLQPSLPTRRRRPPDEERYWRRYELHNPSSAEFFERSIADLMNAGRDAGLPVHDLSHAFDDRQDTLYFDLFHTGPTANRIIAERLAEILAAGGYLSRGAGGYLSRGA